MINALTFDVEEYFQVSNFEHHVPREAWDSYPSRLVESTDRILTILEEHDVRATFFVLGWNARRFPDVVRRIAAAGHEIGSHGFSHRLVYDCSPDDFREDIRRTRTLLRELSGQEVIGYRAPSFSITPRSQWALPILAEEGHRYDSSIFPVVHTRYGWRGENPYPHPRPQDQGPGFWEFPLTTLRLWRYRLPVAGGGYLRILPLFFLRQGIRRANREGQPAIVYLHPWEFDPGQPRMPSSLLTRFRHYHNLAGTEGRLRSLLAEFRFATAREVLGL